MDDAGAGKSDTARRKLPHVFDFAYACFCFSLVIAYIVRWFVRFFKHNLLLDHSSNTFFASDFVVFYQAGKMLLRYGDKRIYDFDLQLAMFNQLIAPAHSERMFAVPYPPQFFLLMSPLALLPMEQAFLFWVWLGYALGLFSFFKVSALNNNLDLRARIIFTLGVASTLLSGQVLELGQPTWILCAAFALFLYSIRQDKHLLAGLAVALASIKPQHACVLLFMLFSAHKWKSLLYAAFFGLALTGLIAAILGFECISLFPSYLISNSTSAKYVGICPDQQVCLRGLLSQLIDWSLAFKISLAFFIASLAYVYWIWRKVAKHQELYCWAYTLSMALMVVFLPHCHAPDTLLLALGVATTITTVSPSRALKLENSRMRLYNCLIMLYPLLGFIVFALWQLIYNKVHIASSVLNILLLVSLARIFHKDLVASTGEKTS